MQYQMEARSRNGWLGSSLWRTILDPNNNLASSAAPQILESLAWTAHVVAPCTGPDLARLLAPADRPSAVEP